MLNAIKSLLSTKTEAPSTQDILEIAMAIDPLLNKIATDVFNEFWEIFSREKIGYIAPAVWGAQKDGEIDATQQKIYQKVNPVIETIMQTLDLKHMSPAQDFAVRFLIKGFIISKLTYMVEMLKNKETLNTMIQNDGLNSLRPMGSA